MQHSILDHYLEADATRHTDVSIQASLSTVQHLLEPGHSDVFLDIGCYDGTKTRALADFVHAKQIYGLDFLAARLAQAQSRGIEVSVFDLNSDVPMPFPDRAFDFVFTGDVIEHIYSPDHLLEEIARMLRPGGYAVLTTPNLASWRSRLALMMGWQPFSSDVSVMYRVGNPYSPEGMPSGHIRVFAPRALRELPPKYGLQVEEIGGRVLSTGRKTLVGQMLQAIDWISERARPTWCDELVVKLRRE